MEEKDILRKARRRANVKRAFAFHGILWLAMSFFFWGLDTEFGNFDIEWSFYPIFFWGLVVFIQGIFTFDFFGYGKKWEKEEIRKEIDKRKKILEEFGYKIGQKEDLDKLDLQELKELSEVYKDSDFV